MLYPESVSSIPITDERELTVAEKLRLTIDLCESGIDVQRERLRREHPDASDEALERRLLSWLHERPGAEHGDADGRAAPDRFRSP